MKTISEVFISKQHNGFYVSTALITEKSDEHSFAADMQAEVSWTVVNGAGKTREESVGALKTELSRRGLDYSKFKELA